MTTIFLTALLLLSSCTTIKIDSQAETGKSASRIFHNLLDEQWEKGLLDDPEWATRLGDNRYNDRLNDVSFAAVQKRQDEQRSLLETVKSIKREKLTQNDQLNYDLFRQRIERDIAGYSYLTHLMPMDQMGGIQIGFADLPDYMPYKIVQDYENYLARLEAFPAKVEQIIELMQRGIQTNWVPPQIVLRSVPDQIKAQYDQEIGNSPLWKPFQEFPTSFTADSKQNLMQKGRLAIEKDVYPAYRKLHEYFTGTYLPSCRETIACSDFPNGDAYYRSRIKNYTTTDLTAGAVSYTHLRAHET